MNPTRIFEIDVDDGRGDHFRFTMNKDEVARLVADTIAASVRATQEIEGIKEAEEFHPPEPIILPERLLRT